MIHADALPNAGENEGGIKMSSQKNEIIQTISKIGSEEIRFARVPLGVEKMELEKLLKSLGIDLLYRPIQLTFKKGILTNIQYISDEGNCRRKKDIKYFVISGDDIMIPA